MNGMKRVLIILLVICAFSPLSAKIDSIGSVAYAYPEELIWKSLTTFSPYAQQGFLIPSDDPMAVTSEKSRKGCLCATITLSDITYTTGDTRFYIALSSMNFFGNAVKDPDGNEIPISYYVKYAPEGGSYVLLMRDKGQRSFPISEQCQPT